MISKLTEALRSKDENEINNYLTTINRIFIVTLCWFIIPKDIIKFGSVLYFTIFIFFIVLLFLSFFYKSKLINLYKLIFQGFDIVFTIYLGMPLVKKFPDYTLVVIYLIIGFLIVKFYFERKNNQNPLELDLDCVYFKNNLSFYDYLKFILGIVLFSIVSYFISSPKYIDFHLLLILVFSLGLVLQLFEPKIFSLKIEKEHIIINSYQNKFLLTDISIINIWDNEIEFLTEKMKPVFNHDYRFLKENAEITFDYIKKHNFVNSNLKINLKLKEI